MSRKLAVAPLLVALVVLAVVACSAPERACGCSPIPASPTATPPTSASASAPTTPTASASADPAPPAALPPVTVTRSGGIAGVQDSWAVSPDGAVVRTERRQPARRTMLAPAEKDELAALATGDGLRAEAGRRPTQPRCADAFVYTVVTGQVRVSVEDCGDQSAYPVAGRIIELVTAKV